MLIEECNKSELEELNLKYKLKYNPIINDKLAKRA